MPPWMLRELLPALVERKVETVHLNGHGETTLLEDWPDLCRPYIDRFAVCLTSNLSRPFRREEREVLARFLTIGVSIDTADARLLAKVRRNVRLSTILENIRGIRAAAEDLKVAGPGIILLAGLYDRNVFLLEGLTRLAVDQRVQGVAFWNYLKHPEIRGAENVLPLQALKKREQRRALAVVDEATAFLRSHGITVDFAGDFLETLRRRLRRGGSSVPRWLTERPGDGETRECLDPWTYCQVQGDGHIFPCCRHGPVGRLEPGGSLEEILNGPSMRKLREGLLTGELEPECSVCTNRPRVPLARLHQKLVTGTHSAAGETH